MNGITRIPLLVLMDSRARIKSGGDRTAEPGENKQSELGHIGKISSVHDKDILTKQTHRNMATVQV